ncbi:MAG: acetyl-CoA C-acyltransferase, partial [Dehalococcoidia bacterium]|nr:acetyl-CoA C-acyltransferase [Dehalococcoidia bacterium]
MQDVVIIDYLRSPFSRAYPRAPEKDLLNGYTMLEVLGLLWQEIIRRNKLDPTVIDEAIMGTATPVLDNFTFGGKFPAWLAKLPFDVACQQTDMQCGSAFCGLRSAVMSITCGFADVALAGGVEHMTHVPMGGGGAIKFPEKLITDPQYKDVDLMFSTNMGFTAQKLQEMVGVTREEMDRLALRSHQLTAKSREWLKGEILPIEVTLPDGSKQMFDYDASCRPDTTMEALSGLKPAYKPDGTITAGNASPLNAGATAMLIMTREKAQKLGLKPLASFISFGVSGVDPTIMGEGPVPATKKALEYAGMQAKDMDFWEINEAFAIVTLRCMKEFGIPEEKVNIHGGAMAIGHPLGASGIRLAGTLVRVLQDNKAKYGCATMCCGGGQGIT